ncbi:hypothetical protein A3780_20315 [Kosakonia radicincitans]|nr:hypothetical protein A3780_20315 [Kosakonia radicincitans]PTA88963.1 hypothetical protein CWM66_21150 [Kosakonia sp. H7A]
MIFTFEIEAGQLEKLIVVDADWLVAPAANKAAEDISGITRVFVASDAFMVHVLDVTEPVNVRFESTAIALADASAAISAESAMIFFILFSFK